MARQKVAPNGARISRKCQSYKHLTPTERRRVSQIYGYRLNDFTLLHTPGTGLKHDVNERSRLNQYTLFRDRKPPFIAVYSISR